MQDLKKEFWKTIRTALISKVPYIVLGWFFYPFIKRTKTREKYYSGKGGWWNRQLWYMLNDDELHRYSVDYDVRKVKDAGIDTSTKLGRFWASYWFNALRNPAYNKSLSDRLISHSETEIPEGGKEKDNLTQDGKKLSPLYWAKWVWRNNSGQRDNRGKTVDMKASIIGTSKVWYHPNGRKDILYLRWSKAKRYQIINFTWNLKFKIWKWQVDRKIALKLFCYYLFRIGAFGNKYDLIIKLTFRNH